MPSQTVPGALLNLYVDNQGAPWNFLAWQTSVKAFHGLFPADENHLPRGLTAEMVPHVQSFIDQYSKIPKEEDRIKFLSKRSNKSGIVHLGRGYWCKFVVSFWAFHKMHARITEILIDADCHPVTILNNEPELKNKPISIHVIPYCLDAVGSALFGPEVLNDAGRLQFAYRGSTQALVQRTWINLCKQMGRSKARCARLETIALNSFNELDREKLTKAKLTAVIRAVSQWSALARVFEDVETMERIEAMEDELKRLMEGLGAIVEKGRTSRPKGQKLCKVSKKSLRSFASEENVADVINMYHDFFNRTVSDCEPGPILEPLPTLNIPINEPVNGCDVGMEIESKLSVEELAKRLGYKNLLPVVFNTHIHRGGLTPWDTQATKSVFDPHGLNGADLDPLNLHWHQLSALHAIMRMLFSAEPRAGNANGILMADEVGLGKTFQSAMIVAFLCELITRHQHNSKRPPVIYDLPYLGESRDIPELPHLIVVIPTLVDQWIHELKVLFKPGSFEIFSYGSGLAAHAEFFEPDSPFNRSKFKANRIIVATHSALRQDYALLYFPKPEGRGHLPWDEPHRKPNFTENISKTLFGQKYLSTTIDEAHIFRRHGGKHIAALLLCRQSLVKVAATATPLLTSTSDLGSMGRLIHIDYFLSREAFADEKIYAAELRRAKKDVTEEDEDDPDNALHQAQVRIAREYQERFQGRIVRRTVNSVNWEKKVLIDLPPCHVILGVVSLTKREMDIITADTDKVNDSVSTANGNPKVATRAFYIDSRIAVGYARQDKNADPPHFATLEEWSPVKSTKIDVVAQICRHTLSSNSAPPVSFEDGNPVFPPVPPLKIGEQCSVKIVIYQEFVSLSSVLQNVLTLYNINLG